MSMFVLQQSLMAWCVERSLSEFHHSVTSQQTWSCLFWKQNLADWVQFPILAKNTRTFLLSNPHMIKLYNHTLVHLTSDRELHWQHMACLEKSSADTGVNFQMKCMKIASHQFLKMFCFWQLTHQSLSKMCTMLSNCCCISLCRFCPVQWWTSSVYWAYLETFLNEQRTAYIIYKLTLAGHLLVKYFLFIYGSTFLSDFIGVESIEVIHPRKSLAI